MKPLLACAAFLVVGIAAQGNPRRPSHGLLLVVNQGDKTMSVVDPDAGASVATIDENQTNVHGHEVAASPDGKTAYVPIYGSSGVGSPGLDGSEMLVIDLPSRTIKAHVDFGHGVRPHCAVYEPIRNLLYVTTELDQAITVINPKSLKIVGKIPTEQAQSHMLAITRDGRRGYVSNVGPGTVSVLDLVARKTIKVIHVCPSDQRIALSRDDRWAFTSDTSKPRMAVIDTSTDTVVKWIDLPGHGYGSAATPDGNYLLVPIPEKDLVAVVDLKSMEVEKTVPVVKSPQEMLVRPDGQFAYVAGAGAKKVAVIDLTKWEMTNTIEVGNFPDGLAWAK